jgi:hypothetical protein
LPAGGYPATDLFYLKGRKALACYNYQPIYPLEGPFTFPAASFFSNSPSKEKREIKAGLPCILRMRLANYHGEE